MYENGRYTRTCGQHGRFFHLADGLAVVGSGVCSGGGAGEWDHMRFVRDGVRFVLGRGPHRGCAVVSYRTRQVSLCLKCHVILNSRDVTVSSVSETRGVCPGASESRDLPLLWCRFASSR